VPATQPVETRSSQLFPRAALPAAESQQFQALGRQQGSSGYGSPGGAPMMGGGAPGSAAQGGQNNEYKPSKFLTSRANLDEVFDDGPDKVKPVIEP
jgi:hypothetical protein